MAPDAPAQINLHPTAMEIAQMPRFCWEGLVPNAKGGEFTIVGCGPSANHFCSGLLYMIRAKGNVKKQTRLGLLGLADADIRYTEGGIAAYPKCSIREDVANARAEVNNLLTIYGVKRPRAQ
jgi:hypothetical protein